MYTQTTQYCTVVYSANTEESVMSLPRNSYISRGDSLKSVKSLRMTTEYEDDDYRNMVITLEDNNKREHKYWSLKRMKSQSLSFRNRG